MSKVYLPTFTSEQCITILDKDTIRVYDNAPCIDCSVSYTDFYVNSHYMQRKGSEYFDSLSTIPSCELHTNFTSDYVYRNDFSDIVIIFIVIVVVCLWFPYKLVSRMFGRWLKI